MIEENKALAYLTDKLTGLEAQLKICVEALKQYKGVAGHDYDQSTTKWSAAEIALAMVDERFRGE